MLGVGRQIAGEQVFEFFQVGGPAEAVEEFDTGKLGFVEGVLGVTGAEVKVFEAVMGEPVHREGHHEHAQ